VIVFALAGSKRAELWISDFAHGLIGKPVSTFPGHALALIRLLAMHSTSSIYEGGDRVFDLARTSAASEHPSSPIPDY
jgi:hypothetical protein